MEQVTFIRENPELMAKYGHLTEGVEHLSKNPRLNMYEKNKLAILLENSVRSFCAEEKFRNLEHIKEAATTSASASTFVTTRLPMIRKVFPNMIARELVSIQPMSQPTMKVFYYDIKRNDGTSVADDIYNRRDYADSYEYASGNHPGDFDPQIKELNLNITDSDVSATEKKLKAQWTVEAQQDIMAYHGLDVEQDLTSALAAEIVRELDGMILANMLATATGGSATFDQTVPAGISYTDRKVWMEGIYEKMCDVDNQIFKKRYRKTTWVVTSPDIATFIEKMSGFVADPVAANEKVIQTGGRYYTGTLKSRWRIYVDPFFPSNKLLMGYNNNADWLDTSYVFCPYIPIYFTETFQDAHSFKKVKACMSRNAFLSVVSDLRGVVTVVGS